MSQWISQREARGGGGVPMILDAVVITPVTWHPYKAGTTPAVSFSPDQTRGKEVN